MYVCPAKLINKAMANPNNVYKSLPKRWSLQVEDVKNTSAEAEVRKLELLLQYPKVTVRPFRYGSRKLRTYHYAIRAYVDTKKA